MAFSAAEVRVLRRALADVLSPAATRTGAGVPGPLDAGYVRDCLRLADGLAEAALEADRRRAFDRAELARYRAALPGAAAGYLERLTAALDSGATPGAEDLAALRRLRGRPCGPAEQHRRTVLLRRCETLAENDVRQRLEAPMRSDRRLLTLPPRAVPAPAAPRRVPVALAVVPRAAGEPDPAPQPRPKPAPKPGARPSGPAGRPPSEPGRQPRKDDQEPRQEPRKEPGREQDAPEHAPKPAAEPGAQPRPRPAPAGPRPAGPAPAAPGRRTPTPAEVFPPGRRRGGPGQARSA